MLRYCNNDRKTTIREAVSVKKLIILLTILMQTACGMKGDLYLPEDNADTSAQEAKVKI